MKRSLVSPALSLVLLCGCTSKGTDGGGATGKPKPSAAIETATVSRGRVEHTIETYGTVEFASDRQRSVAVVKPGEVLDVGVVAGQTVHKGDTLLRVGPMPSGTPEVEQARIEAEFGQRELARVQQLMAQRLATNEDLQQAQKQAAASQAALRALGGGGAGGAQIRASVDGVVASVLVQRGNVVHAGMPVVLLAAGSAMTVRAGFEVEALPQLAEAMPVWLEPVYRGPAGARVRAALSKLQRVVDPVTQLVEGVIDVADAPDWMAAGLAVRVDVVIEGHDDVVRVPRAALLERGRKSGVFVIDGGRAHYRQLELGIRGDAMLEVDKGLAAGDRVATVGRSSLSDGMAVRVSKSVTGPP